MNRRAFVHLSAIILLMASNLPRDAAGQQKMSKENLLGTWDLASIYYMNPDGTKSSTFGDNPKGIAFFDTTGRFVIVVMRSDRLKYASNDRAKGTAEENKATAEGTITYFGTYTVSDADRMLNIHIVNSSFPNWNGVDQKRILQFLETNSS